MLLAPVAGRRIGTALPGGSLPVRRVRRPTFAAQTSPLFGCHCPPNAVVLQESASLLRGHLKKAPVVVPKLFPALRRQALPALEFFVQKILLFRRELLEGRVVLQHNPPLSRPHLPELFAIV